MLLTHPILTVLATGENWRAMGCLSGRIAASEGDKQILASLLNDTLRKFFSKSHINRICLQKSLFRGLICVSWHGGKGRKNPLQFVHHVFPKHIFQCGPQQMKLNPTDPPLNPAPGRWTSCGSHLRSETTLQEVDPFQWISSMTFSDQKHHGICIFQYF